MEFHETADPKQHHFESDPVVIVQQDDYHGYVRDSVFAQMFATLIANQIKKPFAFHDEALETALRLYDEDMYYDAMGEKNEAESSASLPNLLRKYTDNHGEDGEDE